MLLDIETLLCLLFCAPQMLFNTLSRTLANKPIIILGSWSILWLIKSLITLLS